MVESRTLAFSTYHNTITYVFNNIDCKKILPSGDFLLRKDKI